jgi:hypothetical protein
MRCVKDAISNNVRYRDELTEGYNITPNFFIRGIIDDKVDFDIDNLTLLNNTPDYTYHFENRLFDRDTLFVHHYNINFLFVLKSYSQLTSTKINEFRNECQKKFKDSLIKYLDKEFNFYKREFYSDKQIKSFINDNFKVLNGKMYITKKNKLELIIATKEAGILFADFYKFELGQTFDNKNTNSLNYIPSTGFLAASPNEPYGKKDI